MHVNLLGPIEAVNDHGAVSLGGAKQRAVLAMLALQTGSTVSADRLIDGLWGDQPPASALKLVQLHVSHLRKALGEETLIATHGRGYELRLARHDVDAGRFERLLAQGAARDALRLWRGSPLADVAGEPFAAPEIRRLEELHTVALEVAIDQDLDAGRHREVLAEIDGLLTAEPLREPLHARRILALYRCGRQADALEAYREARSTLIEQIGVEPGPELRRLHEAILRQDPALDPPVDGSRRTPLLGREPELERLRSMWRRVRDGASATALITGEPGIGKTRLTLALAEDVRHEGGEVSWGDIQALTPGRPTLLVLDGAVMPPEPAHPALIVMTAAEVDGIMADERIALGPLKPDDAARLARFDAGDDGPIDRIVSASRGVPGLIRQAARDWARAQAMARVADAAAHTAAERVQLQRTAADLTTRVVELQGIREPASTAPAACPYKGLESFDVEDAAMFFGRERLVADMVARLPGAHLLGIVGPSGGGKSSTMRAGLLAAIGAGVLPGSETWARAVIRPGEHPLQTLPKASAGRAVLAVDQFEELFTVCHDERERAAFVEALLDRARRDTLVIAAVRADFYGACARYPELSRSLGANHVLVGPMQRHELRRAIELPARHAGGAIEPELVDALVADVEHEPGALPLLSTALFELWDEGLTLDAYERTGGVRGAVARLAETAYGRLGDDGRAEGRRILLRLAGDGDVRTRVPLAELGDAAVLSALARDRLVTVGEGEAEVAHEALLREWPRLRGWLEEDAEGRRVRHRLTQAARDWEGDSSGLYRGARLAAALYWTAAHGDELNPSERSFLDASRVAAERGTRRLRALAATFAVLLIGALAAGVVALNQRGEARSAALAADAQRLGAEAVNEDHLDRAMALARTGVALDDTPVTRGFLLSVLERNPAAVGEIVTGWINFGGAFSPDGRLFALGDERGHVTVYDARTRLPVAPTYSISALIQQLKFSPDGRRLAVSATNEDDYSRALVDIIDPLHARRLVRIVLPPSKSDPYVTAGVTFLDDGYALLRTTPGGPASVLYRVDARGVVTGQLKLGTTASNPVSEARGRVYLTNARANRTWEIDPERLKVVRTFQVGDSDGAISPDGRRYALGGAHGVRLLDTATEAVHTAPTHVRNGGLIFTPEGLVTQDDDGRLLVWHGDVPTLLGSHVGDVQAIALSPDGRTLLTTSRSRRAILWDLAGDRRLERAFSAGSEFTPIDDTPRGIAISPDGHTLAVTEPDGSVELIDTTTLRRRAAARALDHKAFSVAFSPDGNLLAVTGIGGRVTLWDAHTLAARGELRGLDADSQALAFSPDGRLLAAAPVSQGGRATRIRVWDVPTRRLTAFRATSFANLITFSPDSRLLAAAATEAGTELFDSATGRLVARIQGSDWSRSMAFSPDGRLLFIGQHDGRGRLYTTRGWRPVGREFDGHRDRITFASFSADSRTLATSGGEGTVVLWDVATQKPLGSPLALAPGAYASVALSGSHLFAVSTKGPGVRLDISPAAWERHACLVAGHDLSAQDWADALPGRPQQPVCGEIPGG